MVRNKSFLIKNGFYLFFNKNGSQKKTHLVLHKKMSVYNLNLSDNFDQSRRETIEAYVIDRRPIGPLVDYVEKQNSKSACEPCAASQSSNSRIRPLRYLLRMPPDVKRAYDNPRSDFVDAQTLPGFLTWLMQNGYVLMATKHSSHLDYGFWIKYEQEDGGQEFSLKKKTSSVNPW